MAYKYPQPRCGGCGICLSRTYPYAFCPKCWQEKYHAPPGKNYFPPDKAAANRARNPILEASFFPQPHGTGVSSQVSGPSEGVKRNGDRNRSGKHIHGVYTRTFAAIA